MALAAQALHRSLDHGPPNGRAILRTVRTLGLLQLDSVAAVIRAHYLPLFSRLGAYDRAVLDRFSGHDGRPVRPPERRLFEYWAHEASLLPVEWQPFLRWRMARAAGGHGVWAGVAAIAREQPELVLRLEREIADRGPLAASAVERAGKRSAGWWGWNDTKRALEWLFWTGRVSAAGRRGFERCYDLPERVLPPAVLATPTPKEPDAQRALLRHAATALGIATAGDLRDYFRLPAAPVPALLQDLVHAGELEPVAVRGWRQSAYAPVGFTVPRQATATALLAPFDPLVWRRERTLRLFNFDYRLEIYTPAAKRRHGYYVLPFLMDECLAARLDLRADRRRSTLHVHAAHGETGQNAGVIAERLWPELHRLANWLGLEHIQVTERGDLAPALLALRPPP